MLVEVAVALEDFGRDGEAGEVAALEGVGLFGGEGVAFAGELDGRGHVLREGEFAEVLLRVGEPGDGAGDSAGLVADEGHAGDDVALRVEVHVAAGGGGSLLAVVEEVGPAVLVADEHEAAAADVARCRVDDGEGEADGHGCIDGIAALLEDGDAGVGGVVVDADDHGVPGAGGLLGSRGLGVERGGDERGCDEQGGGACEGSRLHGPKDRAEWGQAE